MTGAGAAEDRAAPAHFSCTGEPNEVRIVITNVKKSVGLITAELYRNDPAGFLLNEGREARVRFAAKSPVTQFCLHAPSSTAFALAVYHDKNANLRIDKGAFGIPVEPYGVYNNPAMRFAAPPVEEALFPVAGDGATVEIKLRG